MYSIDQKNHNNQDSHSMMNKWHNYSQTQTTLEPSMRQKTLMFNSRPLTSSPNQTNTNTTTINYTPSLMPQVNLIKHRIIKKNQGSLYPTPNMTDTTWRIYTTPNANANASTSRELKKFITMTPYNSLQKEFFVQRKAHLASNIMIHQKKVLKGKLFHLLNSNFIMDENSFFMMKLNAKDNNDTERMKVMKHESEYRRKHNVGIIARNCNDILEKVAISHRYEDYHKTPEEFVKENFNKKEIELLKDDPTYYQLDNGPLKTVNMCFRPHLKVLINEEDNKSKRHKGDGKDKERVGRNGNVPQDKENREKVKKMMKTTQSFITGPSKVKQYPYHNDYHKEHIRKLKLLKEDIEKKQMCYTERKQEVDDYKVMQSQQVREINEQKRCYDNQRGLKKAKEKMYLLKIINNLKRNYRSSNIVK